MTTPRNRPSRPWYALAALVPTAVLLAVAPAGAASAASGPVAEAETMTVLAGTVRAYADPTASGGQAAAMMSNSTVSGELSTPAAQTLTATVRGSSFRGAPQALLRVDGIAVANVAVSSSRWTDVAVSGSWTAGRHTVSVSFTNDRYVRGSGDRNLYLDRVAFSAATPAGSVNDAYESRIVALVNIERVKAGIAPVAVSECADRYAEEWSARMAATGAFAHRSDLGTVMRSCGARGVGENIAYGNVSADAMMAMWMGSAGHRANILNRSYTHIGVGAATTSSGRVYGTQNFLTL